MTYEEATKELEQIIAKLEGESLPLQQATQLFERASVLAKFLQEELSKTSGKLFQIKKQLGEILEEEV